MIAVTQPRSLARLVVCLVVAHAAIACADDTAGGGAAGGGAFKEPGPAFASICTGVLVTPQKALPALPSTGAGVGWGGANNPVAPAGTSFLLATDTFGTKVTFRGYLFVADGRPAQMSGDFTNGLIKDTDFTTDCDPTKQGRDTLLVALTLHPNADLSGDPCTLPAGSDLTDLSVARPSEGPSTIAGAGLTALCGFEKGYTGEIREVALISK